MIEQVHLLDAGFEPLLFAKNVLKVKLGPFRPEDGNVLHDQLFLIPFHKVCTRFAHVALLSFDRLE